MVVVIGIDLHHILSLSVRKVSNDSGQKNFRFVQKMLALIRCLLIFYLIDFDIFHFCLSALRLERYCPCLHLSVRPSVRPSACPSMLPRLSAP